MSYAEDLAAAQAAARPYVDVPVTMNGKPYTYRFTKMDGYEWADESDNFPPRVGVAVDRRFGYNLRPLVRSLAPKIGALVTDEGTEQLDEDEWASTFKALDGNAVARICDAVWALNVWDPLQAVESAKKGR